MKFTTKIIVVLVFYCMSLSVAAVAGTEEKTSGPRAFLPDSTFTFEPVVEGIQVQHDFILYNKGNESLEITKVKSG